MITELGHFALILALGVAIVQMVLPAWGAHVREPRLMAVGEPAALAQLTLIAIAFLSLTHAYVTSDFSVESVWSNSHSMKPLIYKISGVWGNHEGSMLLWVLILASFGAAVALFGANLPATLRANVLAVQSGIAVAFLAFIVLASNPFTRIPPAARGPRPQSDPAGPRARLPSAVPLRRLRRPLDRLLVRRRRADRRPHRCRLGALGAAMDAGGLDLPHARHRHGLLVGLLRARLGRLVVLGPGRERLVHAVARRHRAAALRARHGEARGAEGVDHPARHPRLLAVA